MTERAPWWIVALIILGGGLIGIIVYEIAGAAGIPPRWDSAAGAGIGGLFGSLGVRRAGW